MFPVVVLFSNDSLMYKYGKQNIEEDDINAVVQTLQSDWLTQGPEVERFEEALRTEFGAVYACAVANGTAALHLTAMALGWKTEDIVITSPITFLASANCIAYVGSIPDFVDIDPARYTVDPNQLEKKVKSFRTKGENVKAIVAVDYAGYPCDWKALRDIADRYDLQLVNDNCHALGASYEGDTQYAIKYADVITQSFHPVKHITTGEGGGILTNIAKIDEKIRLLRTHGMTKNLNLMEKNDGPWYYEMVELGYNYRVTDFQCSLGISQLQKLGKFVESRREIALRYDHAFADENYFIVPAVLDNVEHAYHLYPLQVKFDEIHMGRKELFIKMEEKQIKPQVHYIPVHLQPYYMKKYGFKKGDFPVSEKFYEREISLPMYPTLTNDDQKIVTQSLYDVLDE